MGSLTTFDDAHIIENVENLNRLGKRHYRDWRPVPEWYMETVMGLYVPEKVHSNEELQHRILGMSESSRNAVVLLYSLSGSDTIKAAWELDFTKYVAIMARIWFELESTSLVNVCRSCALCIHCRYPNRIFEWPATARKNISNIKDAVNQSKISKKACRILAEVGHKDNSPQAETLPKDSDVIDNLQDSLETALEVSQGDRWRFVKEGREAGQGKADNDYRVNPNSLVEMPSPEVMLNAVSVHKKGRAMIAAAGITNDRFNARSNEKSDELGFAEPDRVIEKLIDLTKLVLPKPVLLKTLVEESEEVVPVYRDRIKTPVYLSAYLDVSGSMENMSRNLDTATAVVCALLQVFAPHGTVRVLPFDTEPLKTYEYVFKNSKQATYEWLKKLTGRRGPSLLPSGGGTNIARLLDSEMQRGVLFPDNINYMCLITDAQDAITAEQGHSFRSFLTDNNVSFNTIHIDESTNRFTMSDSKTVDILKSFGTYIPTSQEDFEVHCVDFLKTIAQSYRRAL